MRRATRLLVPLLALLGASGAVRGESVDERLRGLAARSGQRTPLVRIGLEPAHRVAVASPTGFRLLDAATGADLWRVGFTEEINVVAAGGPRQGAPSVFRIQVGAYSDQSAARAELARLERLCGASGVVHHDPDRGNWRVRLGRADDRLALNPLLERLRQEGIQGLWIAEEPAEQVTGVELRLVDGSFETFMASTSRVVALPKGREPIRINGTAYRGIVELRVSPFGTVRPVNWIGLEAYLRGVVPAELGPEVWPQMEALKAQAVAARTYVWRNLGQFEDEGFDLCDSPRCQVYKGERAEHPMSDRAVRSTEGEVLTWQDRPIVALYTATCGGHTETGSEIFPEHDEPYLRGVPCRAEGEAVASQHGELEGLPLEPLRDETGRDVTRDWALLSAVGVLGADPEEVRAAVDASRLRSWTAALARLSGRPEPSAVATVTVATLGQAAAELVESLGWTERVQVLLTAQDLPALLRDPEAASLPVSEQRALGYLALTEGLQAFADGSFHGERPATGARLVPALVRMGQSYEAFGLRQAVVSGVGEDSIRMFEGKGKIRLPVGPGAYLFGLTAGNPVPSSQLEIWPGDRVQFRTRKNGSIDFLELLPPVKGVSDDRTARVYSWEVRKSRHQLEASINRRVSIGKLEDLRVVRRGVSGRIVELDVVGSKASTRVRGFDVRKLLDLRESLLVLELQRDPKGRIEAIVFAGKGWGHGVGLCQVGAYGMALRGATYREITAHYYRGATIRKLGTLDR